MMTEQVYSCKSGAAGEVVKRRGRTGQPTLLAITQRGGTLARSVASPISQCSN